MATPGCPDSAGAPGKSTGFEVEKSQSPKIRLICLDRRNFRRTVIPCTTYMGFRIYMPGKMDHIAFLAARLCDSWSVGSFWCQNESKMLVILSGNLAQIIVFYQT